MDLYVYRNILLDGISVREKALFVRDRILDAREDHSEHRETQWDVSVVNNKLNSMFCSEHF